LRPKFHPDLENLQKLIAQKEILQNKIKNSLKRLTERENKRYSTVNSKQIENISPERLDEDYLSFIENKK
jgi:hypothetical protein